MTAQLDSTATAPKPPVVNSADRPQFELRLRMNWTALVSLGVLVKLLF